MAFLCRGGHGVFPAREIDSFANHNISFTMFHKCLRSLAQLYSTKHEKMPPPPPPCACMVLFKHGMGC